jgi:hypothetical protein
MSEPKGRAAAWTEDLSEPKGRGAAWTEDLSEPKGRGAAWTEERRRSDKGRRRLKSAPEASGEQSGRS